MGRVTKIAWCDHTFNPWHGCNKVSPGCKNCYAESMAKRYGLQVWGPQAPRRLLSENHWRQPARWNRDALAAGERRRVFCGSWCDVFEPRPELEPEKDRLYEVIEESPALDWLLLTKRPEEACKVVPDLLHLPNIWLGITVENAEWMHKRLDAIKELSTYGYIVFLSCEPLLEHFNLRPVMPYVDWVIVGGESGGKARPCDQHWLVHMVAQCQFQHVPVFVKQLGTHAARELGLRNKKGEDPSEWPPFLQRQEFPTVAAQRLLEHA